MSDRRLATIRKISEIHAIPGAERIEKVCVDGWECVVQKGKFSVGDECVYIEVDAIVPKDDSRFAFMMNRKYRVRTIKLRGQISQGLVFSLHEFPELQRYKIGDDVTQQLGIIQYEPPMSSEEQGIQHVFKKQRGLSKYMLRYSWYRTYITKKKIRDKGWPQFIQKTDEERLQNIPSIVKKIYERYIHITEKLDGMSCTVFLTAPIFFIPKVAVCSRNICYWKKQDNIYWKTIRQYKVDCFLRGHYKATGEELVIQGEIIGPNIQKNKYNLDHYEFRVFTVKNIKTQYQYSYREMVQLFQYTHILCVPEVYFGINTMTLVSEFVEYSKGVSQLEKIQREGIVVRDYEQHISFKVINPEFQLQHEDA